MKRITNITIAVILPVVFASCGGIAEQQARLTSGHMAEQSRLLMCAYASPATCNGLPTSDDRDVVRTNVQGNADLTCEFDVHDHGADARDGGACQCAHSTNATFEDACGTWAQVAYADAGAGTPADGGVP